jgi:hypothetical protein
VTSRSTPYANARACPQRLREQDCPNAPFCALWTDQNSEVFASGMGYSESPRIFW